QESTERQGQSKRVLPGRISAFTHFVDACFWVTAALALGHAHQTSHRSRARYSHDLRLFAIGRLRSLFHSENHRIRRTAQSNRAASRPPSAVDVRGRKEPVQGLRQRATLFGGGRMAATGLGRAEHGGEQWTKGRAESAVA